MAVPSRWPAPNQLRRSVGFRLVAVAQFVRLNDGIHRYRFFAVGMYRPFGASASRAAFAVQASAQWQSQLLLPKGKQSCALWKYGGSVSGDRRVSASIS